MSRIALFLGIMALGPLVMTAGAADKFKPDPGFTRLDNGDDLNGWFGDRGGFTVTKDGIIKPKGNSKATIYSQKQHDSDVTIRLEFRASAGSRGGVLIHAKDLEVGDFKKSGAREYAEAAKPLGQWNDLEFEITRGKAVIKLNGKVIEKSWQIGRDTNKGVGLQHESGEVEFRHVQMKDKK